MERIELKETRWMVAREEATSNFRLKILHSFNWILWKLDASAGFEYPLPIHRRES